jgi:ArsR family transcriptional regulator
MSDNLKLMGFEKLFLALSDRTRLRLLALMAEGPVSVGFLADQLKESQPKTSRHLAYLRNAGLVSTSREGKWIYYQVDTQSDPAIQWVLSATINSILGNDIEVGLPRNEVVSPGHLSAAERESYIFPNTYMSEWKPNDLEIHLL